MSALNTPANPNTPPVPPAPPASTAVPEASARSLWPRPEGVRLRGVAFDRLTEQQAVEHVVSASQAGRGGWVMTSNLDHLRRAGRDAGFRQMLEEAALVVADGAPLIWASRLQGTALPERVAGSSLVWTLTQAAAEQGLSVFLLGGDPGTAEEAGKILAEKYPGLRVVGTYCPPMGYEHDSEEMQQMRAALRGSAADLVYVALGSPKQEKLIQQVRGELPEAWWMGVGISLSFICGRVQRAPRWMQVLGLEWVHRLVQEPRRLARRYLIEGIPFAVILLCSSVKRRWLRPDWALIRPATGGSGVAEKMVEGLTGPAGGR